MTLDFLGNSEMPGYVAAAVIGGLGAAVFSRCSWARKPDGKLQFWPFFFALFFVFSIARAFESEVAKAARHFHF